MDWEIISSRTSFNLNTNFLSARRIDLSHWILVSSAVRLGMWASQSSLVWLLWAYSYKRNQALHWGGNLGSYYALKPISISSHLVQGSFQPHWLATLLPGSHSAAQSWTWSVVTGTELKFNRVSDYVPGCYLNFRQGSQYLSRISLAVTYSHLFKQGFSELKLLWNINFHITLWPLALGRSKCFTMSATTWWTEGGDKLWVGRSSVLSIIKPSFVIIT